ncbi:hypothetical protein [Streptomyces sp. NPDC088727]|uniref:hypothetical protein n=1 Tax=Streptomyces sp. NPDC088727 TaxID=3365875 RepID=UPI0038278A47
MASAAVLALSGVGVMGTAPAASAYSPACMNALENADSTVAQAINLINARSTVANDALWDASTILYGAPCYNGQVQNDISTARSRIYDAISAVGGNWDWAYDRAWNARYSIWNAENIGS